MEIVNDTLLHVCDEDIIDGHLELDNSIKHIGACALSQNKMLRSITLPQNLLSIGENAFLYCTNLEKIKIPDSVEFIGESAFQYSGLMEAILPKGIKEIPKEMFKNCFRLSYVDIPSGVKSIGIQAFSQCENLIDIMLPESLIDLGNYAFSNCGLNKISIPKNVESIGDSAFAQCYKLADLVFEGGVKFINDGAFHGCFKLKSVNIPRGNKFIGNSCFTACSNLEKVILSEGILSIGDFTFENCLRLSQVKLPQSIKKIYKSAFYGCLALKTIELPSNLEEIGREAFAHSGLTEIVLPNKIEKIPMIAFSHCYFLGKVIFPDSLKEIDEGAFKDSNINEIQFPLKLVHIRNSAFECCAWLESMELPNSVVEVGEAAFKGCNQLKRLKLNEGLSVIKEAAFYGCGIQNLEIPSSVKTIEKEAFAYNQIKDLSLPEGLENVGHNAFLRNNLENVALPKSLTFVGESAFYCSTLQSISLYNKTRFLSHCLFHVNVTLINVNTEEKRTYEMNSKCDSLSANIIKKDDKYCFFDANDQWVEINVPSGSALADIRNIHEWMKRDKFLPDIVVIREMPIKEIDNFYIKENMVRWKSLLSLISYSHVRSNDLKGLFKLCYVLGMFNKKGNISQRAYEYVKNVILSNEDLESIHVIYGELDVFNKGYNAEFAKLVFKYNDNIGLYRVEYNGKLVSYFSMIYNNFDLIKSAYPNKKINTNRNVDILTLDMCINAIISKQYENVHKGNEELAKNIGLYGYDQEDFERAQAWFEAGKNIHEGEITLTISKDDESNLITYELLDKDNPLGAILGNITNCCQTLNGVGKECVEYGLSERNSKFMVFRYNNKIIGQSWVWYDEQMHRVCLDNVEIPKDILSNEFKDVQFQQEFMQCLKRIVVNFVVSMKDRGLNVEDITVGEGYNDIRGLLTEFPRIKNQEGLTGYTGYSDAENQYVLYKR